MLMTINMIIMNDCDNAGNDDQGCQENSEVLGEKRKMMPFAREASRKLSGSRN